MITGRLEIQRLCFDGAVKFARWGGHDDLVEHFSQVLAALKAEGGA
jgi:hypothetical protein